MNKDTDLIFEAYKIKLSESHPDSTQDYPSTFTSSEEISAYLDELQDGHLDNVWENICDEHGDNEKACIKAFNEYIQNPDDSWREEDAEQESFNEDIDNLYTIIANALDAQDIPSQLVDNYLSVRYSKDKGYKISITEV